MVPLALEDLIIMQVFILRPRKSILLAPRRVWQCRPVVRIIRGETCNICGYGTPRAMR